MSNENTTVVIERIFNAPLASVWAAWTDTEKMKQWWGPKDFTAPVMEQDLRVGGTYLYCMRGAVEPHGPLIDFWGTGTYREIVPMKKIVCSDSFADKDGNIVSASVYGMEGFPEVMDVTIEFEALEDNQTKLTLTHVGAPNNAHADDMKSGWNQSFDKLAESLS